LLYRAVRELATNIAKHAHAQKMKVSVSCGVDNVRLCIEDNGIGFDLSKAGPDSVEAMGFGIFSVRERLKHLGADMQIDSQMGKGTLINIVAPLRSPRKR
ncbi:MAG: ATP-binding protein, partial [Pseudomonadota bacterium]